ncbi:hypothetical protein TNCV_4094491 [Trichonephila clavipes]|nr:hypothetical protein TNCV_4094491 [Trichonephila clavipes]
MEDADQVVFVFLQVSRNVFDIRAEIPKFIHHVPLKEAIYAMLAVTSIGAIWEDLSRSLELSVFLEPFLESGKTTNDKIPDIVFEQLPFDHPVYVAFTSGTSSLPKGIVHQAGAWVRMPETTWMSVNVYCLRGLEVRPLVRLVEEEEIWETTDHSQGILPKNWIETEINRSFTCMVLKAMANGRCHLAL